MKLRRATITDLPAIAAIERESGTASHWPEQDYMRYECTVAEVGAQVAGYLLVRQVAAGEYEVLNIAIGTAYRRQGVASALLASQLQARPGDWFLEVRESNYSARNLYKKLGFLECGIRPRYYSDPPEACIVMTFRS
jgi:ribosomal-protein-alanine N-acetyltransferase